MSRTELEELRKKRGECKTCGRKCFKKKLFKMIPIDEPGTVQNGRCLICHPIDTQNGSVVGQTRKATAADLERFNRSQMNLGGSQRSLMSAPLASLPRRTTPRAHSTVGSVVGSIDGSISNPRPKLMSRSQSYLPPSSAGMAEQSRRAPLAPPADSQPLPLPPATSGRSMPPLSSSSGQNLERDRNGFASGAARFRNSSRSLMAASLSSHDEERASSTTGYASTSASASQSRRGGYEDRGDLHESVEYANTYEEVLSQRMGSDRSIHSASSLGDHHPNDLDGFDASPNRGALNRGGAFQPSPTGGGSRPVGTQIIGGSSRTLSSMSSMEDDTPPKMHSVYEETGDCTVSQSGSSRMGSGVEQEYMHSLQRGAESYADVIMVLREAVSSANVVKQGLEELAQFQLGQEDLETLADVGAPEVIADCLSRHRDNYDVQLWGYGAIWNMSAITRNQLAFVQAGALDSIVAGMEKFIGRDELQEKAIATLSNLGAAGENLPILIDCGAVARIVEAMNNYSEVASVQIKGCSAATNLASHNSPLKSQIMQLGIGGAVVIAMVMHPEDFFLQEKALRALRNLCANSDDNKLELANIGGVDAVISAMQVHRDEVGVQLEGAWTLSNLAGNDANKAVIGDCGGVDVVIRAMWVHSDNVGVQEWCCRALYTLTLDPPNGDVVLEVGGISAIVNAMQAHVDSAAVQEMGCAVLGNLAETKESKMRIVDEEALDAIVLAMVLHADDMQIQERACMVLLRLAVGENYKPMRAANIGELVKTAAQKFPERCQEAATRLTTAFESN
jgi:hypothetical protein